MGFTARLKVGVPGTTTKRVTGTEWDRLPLVPVTVTVYVPFSVEVDVATTREEVPDPPVIVSGLNVVVRPLGEADAVRVTVPVNPLEGVIAIV